MYCNCNDPKIVDNHADHKTFKVCSKSRGGCGREYDFGKRIDNAIKPKREECGFCSGTGVSFDFMLGQTLFCAKCDGKGFIGAGR